MVHVDAFILYMVMRVVLTNSIDQTRERESRNQMRVQEHEPLLQMRQMEHESLLQMRQRGHNSLLQTRARELGAPLQMRPQESEVEFMSRFEQHSEELIQRQVGRTPDELLQSFHTSDEIVAAQYPHLFVPLNSDTHHRNDHDHDRCCPTRVLHEKPFLLQNTNGEIKVLAHFPRINRFQFVRRAECVPLIGNCDGRCVVEDITAYFVVWNITGGVWPFTIDRFDVPGYCSCKSR